MHWLKGLHINKSMLVCVCLEVHGTCQLEQIVTFECG